MKQKLIRIITAGSLIVVMGLGASAITASAKTTAHKKTIPGKVTVAPTVVTGTQYTMTVKKGNKSYVVTFDTATAKLVSHKGGSIAVGKIVVGNKLHIKGLVDTSAKTVTDVTKIRDDSIK